jgi:hypothetical protein
MRAAIQVDFTCEQVLNLVKLLQSKDKIKLSKELEKEGIDSKISKLLVTFKAEKLSLATIRKEAEIVRKQLHESKKA